MFGCASRVMAVMPVRRCGRLRCRQDLAWMRKRSVHRSRHATRLSGNALDDTIYMFGIVNLLPIPPLHIFEGRSCVVMPTFVVPVNPTTGVGGPGELADGPSIVAASSHARSAPPRRAAPSSPAATARCPTHRWTHDRCRQRSPSGRMVRAYAAIGRRRHGPLCCRRANGALRFVLTIDYGPSLPPTEIITRALIDPILTRWSASERLQRAGTGARCGFS